MVRPNWVCCKLVSLANGLNQCTRFVDSCVTVSYKQERFRFAVQTEQSRSYGIVSSARMRVLEALGHLSLLRLIYKDVLVEGR
jgi:hypothetical protein